MHYYKRNIGDYSKKAGRLSILQHGVYNLLIDACYDREDFPTTDQAIDWVWASTPEEEDAVRFVLKKFFVEGQDGKWVQKRIAEEIAEYRDFCAEQGAKGKRGGRPRKKPDGLKEKPAGFSGKADGNPDESQRGEKETLTTNHKPLTTNQKSAVPKDKFTPDDHDLAERIFDRVLLVAPKTKKPNLNRWADQIRLMREQDGHTLAEIEQVFMFANSDHFWWKNIQCPTKLREKFARLHGEMTNGVRHANGSTGSNPHQSRSDRADQAVRDHLSQH